IDEAAFHSNMKLSYAWSKKGFPAIVKVAETRAPATTILGAISPFGVVHFSVRCPKAAPPSKKRNCGTADKAVSKHLENRGYRCVYPPSYFPELNPIDQFGFICKSKVKREKL
ncbi:hypothetical protein BX666DRAFT_1832229, partial [Dichotomocladium elegans]